MEVKKSREADLEQKRTQAFLLGIIVVLASLFVLLEWNSGGSGWTLFDDDDSLEAEVELSPLKNFYTAEDYHQDYLDKNPDGYCHLPLELFEMAKRANR